MSRMAKAIQVTTTFPPAPAAALYVLARRDDGGRGAANGIITRLLREELERIRPGLWDKMLAEGERLASARPKATPTELQSALAAWLGEELGGGK